MLTGYVKNRNGQTMVMVVLFMVVLMGFVALTTNVGALTVTKSDLQNAADAAALAGVQELPGDPAQARIVAQNYVTANGKPGDTTTVTIGTGNKSITVAISRTEPAFLGRTLGTESNTVSADATATTGVAGSVPWIVPFTIPKPAEFRYDKVYVMRMYGGGDFLDYTTGYPSGYTYPSDYRSDPVYRSFPISSPYPYQFDYMNVYIERDTDFSNYIEWLEKGYHKTFTVNQNMYYYSPSSGGRESVNAFAKRIARDPNTDYTRAKLGDGRVMLIPVVESMLSRETSSDGSVPLKIVGFVGFFLQKVHKNSYGQTFWFEGRFLENLNIGSGEVTFDTDADFGLRVQKLTE